MWVLVWVVWFVGVFVCVGGCFFVFYCVLFVFFNFVVVACGGCVWWLRVVVAFLFWPTDLPVVPVALHVDGLGFAFTRGL